MIATSVFLLPNGTFFIELVTVVVILLLMTKYILPPLNAALESRQEKIREALAAAEAAKADAAAAGDERQRVLAEARDQAREIVAAAQTTSDSVKAESVGRGQAEYDRILANAASEVDTARQRAIDEASARIGEIVFVPQDAGASAHRDRCAVGDYTGREARRDGLSLSRQGQ